MKNKIYKLSFPLGVHFGKKDLSETDFTFSADTFFSAIAIEALSMEDDTFRELYEAVSNNKLIFSDACPFINEQLYVPKPFIHVEREKGDMSSRQKKFAKKLKYLPVDRMEDFFSGRLNLEKEVKNFSALGKKVEKVSVSIYGEAEPKPYRVAAYCFNENCGLYICVRYEGNRELQLFEKLLDALSYSGIGGERSSGYFSRNSEDMKMEAETFRGKTKEYLKNQDKKLSTRAFHSLNRKEEDLKNAVNDIMSCIRISDSQPLSTDNLILCQKIDISVSGNENSINTTRECIRPNTKITFDLTITNEFPFSLQEIQEAVGVFAESYFQNSFRFFNKVSEVQAPKSDTIWIGGGVGYVSKTVMYPLFGYQKGLKVVSEIMKRTAPQKRDEPNKHRNDFKNGVSPHMLKCTYSQGKLYEFGRCKIKFTDFTPHQ